MAKARTTRPTPQPTDGQSEVDYIADRLVDKVWQGNEDRRGIAAQAASVALAAIQDYTASRYMETADQFTGQQLVQRWLNRHALLEEARASVALDRDPRAETIEIEGTVSVGVPLVREEHWADKWELMGDAGYQCGHVWNDGTRCDQMTHEPVGSLHVRMVPDTGGAYTRKPPKDPNLLAKFLAKQVEDGAEIAGRDEFEGNWRDDL